jgi:cell division protein FtsN
VNSAAPHRAQKLPRSHPRNRTAEPRPRGPGATSRRPSQPKAPVIPGWLYLVAGLGAGMLITSLVKLSAVPVPDPAQKPAAVAPLALPTQPAREPAPAARKQAVASEEAAPTTPETRFDFYTLLPEREVIVPDQQAVEAAPVTTPKPPTAQATPTPSASSSPTPALPTTTPPATDEVYLLQAGSFRGSAEAERRRAQIEALGLTARIESVAANGDTWYRVQAGPFTSSSNLSSARSRLSGAGIETLLLRRRPQGG